MVKPYLYIDQEEDFWEDDTNDDPGRGMSGWLTGADGAFRIPYRSELKFGTGDYTVIQTFNSTASGGTRVASYDDYGTNDGVRFSQLSDTFTVESGPVSVVLPSNIFDGTNRYFMVERESGVAVNAYVDDFEVVTASGADGGADLSNTEDLDLAYDGTTYMDGMLGLTITFQRLLEEYEKDDLFYWIDSGYNFESEPDWIRSAASLYINPTDPVQRAEYAARENIVNLAVSVPDEIYIRYEFISSDGLENPELQASDIKFSNLKLHSLTSEDGYDGGPSPRLLLGHGEQPDIVLTGSTLYDSVTIPLEELGASWFNNDWTIVVWIQTRGDGTASDILTQGGGAVYALSDEADDSLSMYVEGVAVVSTVTPSPTTEKYSMVTIRKSGTSIELFIDDTSVGTGTANPSLTLTEDIVYNPAGEGVIGPLHIWTRAMGDEQIAALYNSTPEVIESFTGDSFTITDSFSAQSLNWERR